MGFVLLGGAALFLCGLQPAAANWQLIVATNSAASKASAARAAHQNAIDSANQLKRQFGWRYVTLRARKVEGRSPRRHQGYAPQAGHCDRENLHPVLEGRRGPLCLHGRRARLRQLADQSFIVRL